MSMSNVPVGSLEELVTGRVAEFIRSGLDTPTKLSLIETASHFPALSQTASEYAGKLGYALPPEAIRVELERLVKNGLFLRQEDNSQGEPQYRLTEDSGKRVALDRMLKLLSDPNFRSLAVAQLRYSAP